MASVSPFKFRFCATCKAADPERTKPADDCQRCKVLAYRVYWRQPDGTKRSEVFDLAKGGLRAANAKKAEVEDAQRLGTYIDPHGARTLFMDYADEWAAAQEWKQATLDIWPTRRKLLAAYVGERTRLGSIDKLRLEKIRKDLHARYSVSYTTGTMHMIKAILRMAVASGKIHRDPTIGVSATPKRRADDKTGRVTPDKVPTAAEAWRILMAAPDDYRAAHALGLAGLRIGEALGLRVDHIDFATGTLSVDVQATEVRRQGVRLTTPKAEKVRTIEVPPEVLAELRRHLAKGYGGTWTDADGNEHRMLFLQSTGKLLSKSRFYDRGWHPALKAAGFVRGRFSFHGYRHLCASHMLAKGTGNAIVAGHLGHHLYTLERVYAHWLRDDKAVPARILHELYAEVAADAAGQDAQTAPNASQMPHAA